MSSIWRKTSIVRPLLADEKLLAMSQPGIGVFSMGAHVNDKVRPLVRSILHRHFFGSRLQGKLFRPLGPEMQSPKLKRNGEFPAGLTELLHRDVIGEGVTDPMNLGRDARFDHQSTRRRDDEVVLQEAWRDACANVTGFAYL